MAGSRSYVLTGPGALLHNAVLRMAQDFMIHEQGFYADDRPGPRARGRHAGHRFLSPPVASRPYRVGESEEAAEEIRFLTGTGEVGLTAFHMDEILHEADLPKTYVTLSTCFRREAGTYGKDTSGLYRIHQFDKVEQVVLCKK